MGTKHTHTHTQTHTHTIHTPDTYTQTHTHTRYTRIHSCVRDMTHPCVWHAPFIWVTWRIHTLWVTQLSHTCDTCFCATWLIHMFDMTHSMCNISCPTTLIPLYVTGLIHICDMTHSYCMCGMSRPHDASCQFWRESVRLIPTFPPACGTWRAQATVAYIT